MTPVETIRGCYARIEALSDRGIFISLRGEHEVIAEAKALNEKGELYGVPLVVKDNIGTRPGLFISGDIVSHSCPLWVISGH